MNDNPLFQQWIEKADEDFYFASHYIEDEEHFFAPLCFHFHQAAEKYLKSFIVAHHLSFRKIHNLKELVQICVGKDDSFSNILDECIYLNQFYIETRYPVHWPTGFTKKDAYEAKENALAIGTFIKDKLSMSKDKQ